MVVIVVCGLLLLLGVVGVVRWGAAEVRQPQLVDADGRGSLVMAARRYVGYVTVLVVAGVGAGVLVAGAGGRLVMRLLALTADDAAQGRETEAEEIVGQITAGGTVGFIIFTGLFFGLASGALYLLIRRWLPGGRLGGLAFGVLLLVVAATRIEPLRGDNTDFDIVGPGWVAATAFGTLVVLHGMLVAALAARYSRALPLVAADRGSLLAHAPLLVLIPAAPVLVLAAAGGVVAVGLSRLKPVVEALRSHKTLVGGRILLAGIGLAALPGCISAVVDIAGRGP
jgi:hypothetical protein